MQLAAAPLVYTLGVVGFPTIPDITRFLAGFHDGVRKRFPLVQDFKMPSVSVTVGPEGMRIDQQEVVLWQFSTPDQRSGLILAPDLLALHTVDYRDHVEFIDTFRFGLERLVAVPAIGVEWLVSVAMRYVNLIVPRESEPIGDYLKATVLPLAFEGVPSLRLKEGVYVSRYQTGTGELRFQVLRNPATVLPPELETPVIQFNKWQRTRPERDFAVVDTDYGLRFVEPKAMDVADVSRQMYDLRAIAKEVFLNIGTDHAHRVWRGEA